MANINKIRISGTSYDIQDSNAPKVVELTQAQYDALVDKDPNVFYIITDASPADMSQYWTSAQTNSAITEAVSGKADSSSVYLKSETSGATEISTALNDKLDVTAYTPTDLSNYYTTAQTNTKISQAVSGKTNQSDFSGHTANTTVHVTAQDKTNWNNKSDFSGSYNDLTNKLSAGTNITIVDNVISAEGGGGKAIEAGRGISITTGATADTVSFNLPISAGTGEASVVFGKDYGSDMFLSAYTPHASSSNSFAFGSASVVVSENSFATGYQVKVKGSAGTSGNFAQGYMTTASGNRCHSEGLCTSATSDASHSEGYNTAASGNYSHSEGEEVKATNVAEHSQGRYNVSNKANTTWGDSGNTLFSVGNGTADNARHNAFEIRQNGDIYLSSGGTDIKLQDHLGGGGGGGNVNVVELTQAQYDALTTVDPDTIYVITDAQGGDLANYMTSAQTTSAIAQAVSGKTDNSDFTGHTADTTVHVTAQDKTNWNAKLDSSAITTSISSSSTDAQVPSAKAVYDIVGNIETLLSQI